MMNFVKEVEQEENNMSKAYLSGKLFFLVPDTPTAKAHWVLNYVDFQIYSKVYKTNLFY